VLSHKVRTFFRVSELLKTPHFMPKKGVLAIGVPDPPKVGTTGSMISMT
jgi:hypothetical protein